jgi:hypothetical protein
MPNVVPQSSGKLPKPQPKPSLLDRVATVVGGVLTFVQKAPIAVLFVAVAIVLYFHQSDKPEKDTAQFNDPTEAPKEQPLPPPSELPAGMNPSVWTCVSRSDSQLSNGLWAEIYYGMEARLDGKMMTAKVTEKWQDLSEDKRKTVASLIVDTWVENGQALRLLNSRDELEEVVIQLLPDEGTVARWTPSTGLQLLEPQPTTKSQG